MARARVEKNVTAEFAEEAEDAEGILRGSVKKCGSDQAVPSFAVATQLQEALDRFMIRRNVLSLSCHAFVFPHTAHANS